MLFLFSFYAFAPLFTAILGFERLRKAEKAQRHEDKQEEISHNLHQEQDGFQDQCCHNAHHFHGKSYGKAEKRLDKEKQTDQRECDHHNLGDYVGTKEEMKESVVRVIDDVEDRVVDVFCDFFNLVHTITHLG